MKRRARFMKQGLALLCAVLLYIGAAGCALFSSEQELSDRFAEKLPAQFISPDSCMLFSDPQTHGSVETTPFPSQARRIARKPRAGRGRCWTAGMRFSAAA